MPDVITLFLPTLVPIAVGYTLARHLGLSANPLRTVARYALVPPLLFALLLGTFQTRTIGVLSATGAGMVLVVLYAVPALARASKLTLEGGTTMPNLAVLALPFLSLSWGAKSVKSAPS